jgi:2-methylcitrate dehydratase PrpD
MRTHTKLRSSAFSNPLSLLLIEQVLNAYKRGLPTDLVAKTHLHIADAVAIGLAARDTEMAKLILESQLRGAGKGKCVLIGGGHASALAATFINSALIHILDFDDIYDAGRLHPGTVVLPAALAAANLSGASDKEIVASVALASEVMCKLGVIASPKGEGPGSDWFLTQLFGYVAAAIAAGLVLKLSPKQLVSAVGLAYMQVAGGKEAGFGTGSNARSIYPAYAAQGGLQAALMAQAGVLGPVSALDGAAGLFKIYFGAKLSASKRSALLDFTVWHSQHVQVKPWPSCRLSHPYVLVGMAAQEMNTAKPEAVIRVAVNASAAKLCKPLAGRRQPKTLQDAKYSIPFMTAFALVKGAPTLVNLTQTSLTDPAILATAARIVIDEVLPDKPGHPNALLTLEVGRKKILTERFKQSDLVMTAQDIESKFKACFEAAQHTTRSAKAWRLFCRGKIQKALIATNV